TTTTLEETTTTTVETTTTLQAFTLSEESSRKAGSRLLEELGAMGEDDEARIVVRLRDDAKLGKELAGINAGGRELVQEKRLAAMQKAYGRIQSNVLSRMEGEEFKAKHMFYTANAMSGTANRRGVLKLLADPNVESVSLDEQATLALDDSVPVINGTTPWSQSYLGAGYTGKHETVCVIDTGIRYTHDNLGDGWGNRVLTGYDFGDLDTDPNDPNSHGTHCAGIVASDHATWKGVAPEANLIAAKILMADTWIWMSDIQAAVEWCTANATKYNISVITMSLSSTTRFDHECDGGSEDAWVQNMRDAVNAAYDVGIFVVAASGNDADLTSTGSPACHDNVTAVGATYDEDLGRQPSSGTYTCGCYDADATVDSVACYSNRPSFIDVWAPGSSIYSCGISSDTSFVSKGGTSMATPHVAGAAAVLQQYSRVRRGVPLTPDEIKQHLIASGKSVTRDVTKPRIDEWKAMLDLGNTAPVLNETSIMFAACQEYYLNVTYTDAENNTPEFMRVDIDGTQYDMTEMDASDVDKTDGKGYYYDASVTYASHDLFFTAGDGFLNDTTATYSFNMNPTSYLSSPSFTPAMAESSKTFTFTVTYTDLCDRPKNSINVTINGVRYAMTESDAGDTDNTDGKDYELDLTGLAVGTKSHFYRSVNDQGIVNTTGVTVGPRVNGSSSCTGDSPPGVGSALDWTVGQETMCVDCAFIPSTSGLSVVQDRLVLTSATVYSEHEVVRLDGGAVVLNNSVLEFIA
ncbi:MAG: S8 family serine peptidase, partial [Candidatus Altiarchaeota archaeon]